MRRQVKAEIDTSEITDMRERWKARRANAKEKKAAANASLVNQIREAKDADDPLEVLFDLLVPASGPSKYQGGEIVRAMMRILYRDMNDGDVFYEGYGIETCADAVAFIIDMIPDLFNDFENIAYRELHDTKYTDAITEIADKVVEYLYDGDIEEILAPNTQDFQKFDGAELVEANNWEPEYDYECDYPDNVLRHLDRDDISLNDVESELAYWDCLDGENTKIDADTYSVYVSGLRRDDYEEVKSNLYRWLEQWGQDLDDEYGDEDYEDDEYEEDEE